MVGPLFRDLVGPHRHCRLVEPLCGGLAVAFGLKPRQALLNDSNPHLINFWRWLQRGLVVEIALKNRAEGYYAHRQRFNQLVAAGQETSAEAEPQPKLTTSQ